MVGKAHWEQVYREKSDREVSWYQSSPACSLQLVAAAGLRADAPLIDVGGGASRLVDALLDAGFEDVTVLDLSSAALAVAQARLAGRADQVRWLEADITDFQPARRHALWHDRAVFHFLTRSEDRASYLAALRRGLLPGGHLLMATFAPGGPQKCSGLDIVQYDADKLSAVLGADFVLEAVHAEGHLTPAGKRQDFNYFHYRYRPRG